MPLVVAESVAEAEAASVGSLAWGSVEILDAEVPGEPGARIEVSADGSNFGNPKVVITVIRSMLLDGSLGSVESYDNREIPLSVLITATDGDQLARVEALLAAEDRKGRNLLTWTPQVVDAEPAVFEVVWSEMAVDWSGEWDIDARYRCQRAYNLTLTCRPFARSLNLVTVDAVPPPSVDPLVISDGSSTTGWSLISPTAPVHTNLETNPEFASNTSGYTAGAGTASVSWANLSGRTQAIISSQHAVTRSYLNGPLHTVSAGSTYEIGMVADTLVGSARTLGALVRFYSDTAGTVQIGSDTTFTDAGGSWVTRTWNVTAPASAVRMRVYRFMNDTEQAATSWSIDKQWTVGPVTGSVGYFAGSSTSTAAVTYAWTGTANASTSTATWASPVLAVVSGAVRGTVYGRGAAAIRLAGPVAMGDRPYLRIQGTATVAPDGQIIVADNGGDALAPASYYYSPTTGAFDITVQHPDGFAAVDLAFSRTSGTVPTTGGLFVAAKTVSLISGLSIGTARQRSQTVQVYGSRRTDMSLLLDSLSSDTVTGQGTQTLVFTEPANTSGLTPALGQYRSGGPSRTPDDTKLSGSVSTMATTEAGADTYRIPVGLFAEGTHEIIAAVAPTTANTAALARWSVEMDSALGSTLRVEGSAMVPAAASTSLFRFVSLGRVTLPLAATEGASAAEIVLKVWDDSAAPGIALDEAYLLNTTTGQVTIVDTSRDGAAATAMRIDAATVDNPKPTVWLQDADGAWQAAADRAEARDQHIAEPGLLSVFVASMRSLDWTASGNYYPRWDTHPAKLPANSTDPIPVGP